ncbi:MAG: HAMP domain-containing sensor histidine kinase [Planctomycetota bacterium]
MRRSASVSRRALALFVAVVLIAFAQLAWWVVFQIGQARARLDEALGRSTAECRGAADAIRLAYLTWAEQVQRFRIGAETPEPVVQLAREGVESGLFGAVGVVRGEVVERLAGEGDLAMRAERVRELMTAPFVQLDGMPLVWLPRLERQGGASQESGLQGGRLPEETGEGVVLWARPSLKGAAALIAARYPHVELGSAPAEGAIDVFPGVFARVTPRWREELERSYRKPLVMFVTEGGFFCVLLLAGVLVIYVTLRQEVALKSRQANFISAVSHELKSPLASLRLHLQTLQMREVPEERRRAYLANMEDDLARLDRLTRNLLAAARLRGRQPALPLEPRDLAHDVRRFLEETSEDWARQGIGIKVEVEDDLPLLANAEGLRSVLHNLLDNAAKYSAGSKTVSLRAYRDGSCAVLEVTDRGIGIAPEEQRKIFEPFYRVGNELVREREGTGLGLYVVQEIVTVHGGRVEVRSEGAGKGSTFRVIIPFEGRDETAEDET